MLLADSVLWRVLTRGVGDAERRLQRLTAPEERAEPVVLDVLERSLPVRSMETALDRFDAALRSSVLVATAAAVWEAWRHEPFARRRRLGGAVLGIATAVHLLLTIVYGAPLGWLWLILPAIAGASAALLIAAGASSASSTRQGSP